MSRVLPSSQLKNATSPYLGEQPWLGFALAILRDVINLSGSVYM